MSDTQDSAAPVTIEVPAAHASLFQRIKALIERDEQWIVDNIHAGIAHFEKMVGDAKDDLTPTID